MSAMQLLAPEAITLRIATVRGQRVIVDADLAALYGVETKRFNEAVKRNLARFPADFMFQLDAEQFAALRELATSHGELAQRLAELEDKTEALAMNHDTFSRNTRNQLKQVFDALRELMTPPDPPKRPIGFVTHEDGKDKR